MVAFGVLGLIGAQAAVVINEFEPDPAGADGGFEWVELYNDGGAAVDLTDWTIRAATSGNPSTKFTFPGGASIPAGGYVVVGGEFVVGATYSLPTGDVIGMGNAGSSGDILVLVDPGDAVIDTVIYGPDNADAFLDDDGGIAGSVAPTAPSGVALARMPNGTDTNQSGNDFALAGFATLGSDNNAAVPSCDTVAQANVVINELVPNPDGADTDMEWVELYNAGGSVDLSGWVIASGTSSYSTQSTLPPGTTLSGQFLVVGQSSMVTFADVVAAGFVLGNASNADGVQLRDCFGSVADTVIYGTDNAVDSWLDDNGAVAALAPLPGSGASIGRVPDGADSDNSAVDFVAGVITPGASNDATPPVTCDPASAAAGLVINEVVPDPMGADADMEWIELYLPSGTVDISGWIVTAGTSNFSNQGVIPPGSSISGGQHLVVAQSGLFPLADLIAPGFELGNASNADAVQLRDCLGAPVDTVVYGLDNTDGWLDDNGNFATLAQKPGSGESIARIPDGADTNDSLIDFEVGFPTPGLDNETVPPDCGGLGSGLVVNELLSNPAGPDTGAEWVELYHAGSAPIDLWEWRLESAGSDSWSTRFTFEDGDEIFPGEYLLVGGEFVTGATHLMTGSIGNGTNGDGVRIVDCGGFIADAVVYGGTNDDLVVDESGAPASSVAPTPPEDGSIQRVEDGYDTNQSGLDFAVADVPTPGGANIPIEPVFCTPNAGGITINEILPDPDGVDDGLEFVELFNSTGSPIDIDGWSISAGTSNFDNYNVTLPGGQTIAPGGFFVIGGEFVEEADYEIDFSLGNASSSRDGVRLYDCEGNSVDTVIYGVIDEEEPDIGIVDDNDLLVDPYGDPGSDQALYRLMDGVDTDAAADWQVGRATPGSTNDVDFGPGVDTDPLGGCGCGNPNADDAPDGNAPAGDPPTSTRCATGTGRGSLLGLMVLAVGLRRRR